MRIGESFSNKIEMYCANLVDFKQECDQIYNGFTGRNPSLKVQPGSEIKDCGIWSPDFLNVVLPFASDHDTRDNPTDQFVDENPEHKLLDIRLVMTRRRAYYAARSTEEGEISYAKSRAEELIRDDAGISMLVEQYGILPLYQCYQNMNLANLAWRVRVNIRFRVAQRYYPKAEQLQIRKWRQYSFLVFRERIQYILFPRIIIPILEAYGVENGPDLQTQHIASPRITQNIMMLSEFFNSNWSDNAIESYYPGASWLKGGGLERMISASNYIKYNT